MKKPPFSIAFTASILRLSLVFTALTGSSARAANPIYNGPSFDSATWTGYRDPSPAYAGDGVAVGFCWKYIDGGTVGTRAVRWDASGIPAVELGGLSNDPDNYMYDGATAINAAGTAVGYAEKFPGAYLGYRAVRWDAGGIVATELDNLGTNSDGFTNSYATAINAGGTIAGYALKLTPTSYLGERAVRWDASGIAATELGNLGTNNIGVTSCYTVAINTAGTIVGYATKYSGGTSFGYRAVRWDASGTAATELGNLGTDNSGYAETTASAINAVGTTIGRAEKYSSGVNRGERAVRWNASSTAATELGNLGTDDSGITSGGAAAINSAGTTVGWMQKYIDGEYLGDRAVRWEADGTAAEELGILGVDDRGFSWSYAAAINAGGTIVGRAEKFTDDADVGQRAVAWGADGLAIDLNTLLLPADAAMWTLTEADSISDTNWIAGIGFFDPDGAGGLDAYPRMFLLNGSSLVPEPSTFLLAALGFAGLARCHRRMRVRD